MTPKNIVITGGSRGIGLGLVKSFLENEHHILTTSTSPLKAKELLELKENYPEFLEIIEFHGEDPDSLLKLAEAIGDITSTVDLLINNAGVIGASTNNVIDDQSGSFFDLKFEAVEQVLKINTIAPLLLTKELLMLLRKSTDAKVINISSGMGSISQFMYPDHLSYCVSKAGLNMVTKALSSLLLQDSIPVVSVSPGWVKTDMGGVNAELSIDESVAELLPFIDSVNMEMTGGFFKKNGEAIPY